jgi:uncharacterized protein (TIGR03067 family)
MYYKTWLATAALILLTAASARAQAPLDWKLKEGQTFYIEEKATLNLSGTVAGEEDKEETTSTILSRITVLKEFADRSVLVEQQIESSKTKSSGKPETDDVAMKGVKFRMTLGPTMRATKFEGYDDLVRGQSGGNAEAEKTLRAEMSEAEMGRRLSEPFNVFLPDEPVAQGAPWTKTRDITVGPLGTMLMTLKYTPAGEETVDGLPVEKIVLTGEAKHTLPKPSAGAGFQFTKGHLNCNAIQGVVLFDKRIGRLVRMDFKLPFDGLMTISGGGAEVQAKYAGSLNQTIRMFGASKPAAAPATGAVGEKTERAKFNGKWVAVAITADGTEVPADTLKEIPWYWIIDQQKILSKRPGRGGQTTYNEEIQIAIDPAKTPKTVDTTDPKRKETNKGIYEFEGDTLKICFTMQQDGQRPDDFTAKTDSQRMFIRWKRVEAPATKPAGGE